MTTYILDGGQLSVLQRVKNGLYGDGRVLTPDARRDLANTMDAIIHSIETLGPVDLDPCPCQGCTRGTHYTEKPA